MRRRVALAQALLGDPRLVLLDEPTAGLDPEQRLRFRELISRLAEDRCVLISTHQTDDVSALCRRVVVLSAGEVAFAGAPGELAEIAVGRVWLSGERADHAQLSWLTGDGRHRHVGGAPPLGAELVTPTLEDGYLMLVGLDQPRRGRECRRPCGRAGVARRGTPPMAGRGAAARPASRHGGCCVTRSSSFGLAITGLFFRDAGMGRRCGPSSTDSRSCRWRPPR